MDSPRRFRTGRTRARAKVNQLMQSLNISDKLEISRADVAIRGKVSRVINILLMERRIRRHRDSRVSEYVADQAESGSVAS